MHGWQWLELLRFHVASRYFWKSESDHWPLLFGPLPDVSLKAKFRDVFFEKFNPCCTYMLMRIMVVNMLGRNLQIFWRKALRHFEDSRLCQAWSQAEIIILSPKNYSRCLFELLTFFCCVHCLQRPLGCAADNFWNNPRMTIRIRIGISTHCNHPGGWTV